MPAYDDLVRRGEKAIQRQQNAVDTIQWKVFRAADKRWHQSRRLLTKTADVIEIVMREVVAPTLGTAARQVKKARGRRSVTKTPR